MNEQEKTRERLHNLENNYMVVKAIQDDMEKRLDVVEGELRTKMPLTQFYWIFGITLTILGSILGYIVWQVNDVQITSRDTRDIAVGLEKIFDNIDIKLLTE